MITLETAAEYTDITTRITLASVFARMLLVPPDFIPSPRSPADSELYAFHIHPEEHWHLIFYKDQPRRFTIECFGDQLRGTRREQEQAFAGFIEMRMKTARIVETIN